MELTEIDHLLLEEVRLILPRLARAERATLSAATGEQGKLRVGVAPTAPFYPFVPRIIRASAPPRPSAPTRINGVPGQLASQCRRRQASQPPLVIALIRFASISIAKGLVSICIPGSSCSLPTTAFSA